MKILLEEDGQDIAEYAIMLAVLLALGTVILHFVGVNVVHLMRQAAERIQGR